MTDTPEPTKNRQTSPRLQHVVAHLDENHTTSNAAYDEFLVFGQKIDALEYCHGKPGWVYAAVAHGQSFVDALKAARS